jgi:methylated-DNA-protein-cysteine methyltransferase-like protein
VQLVNDYERVYAVIKQIPKGRVATYGQIARLAGIPGQARRVGYALSALSDHRRVAWHRVVNAKGEISARSKPHFEQIQRALLIREGIVFGMNGQIPLSRFQWKTETLSKSLTRLRLGNRIERFRYSILVGTRARK